MTFERLRHLGWGAVRLARRRFLRVVATAALAATAMSPSGWAAAPQSASDPKAFIDTLGNEVLSIIKSPNLSQAQRQAKFRSLFSENFDVPTIARFVVGVYWRRASPGDQQAYVDTFRNYIAAIYADQFANYRGEGFKTISQRPLGGDETLVKAEIDRPNQPPIRVDFRVKGSAGSFKIVDVTVEDVSLIITKRDEFGSVLAQGGLKSVTQRMQAVLNNTQSG
jgi:phospholipid transport system substrate-binding protein